MASGSASRTVPKFVHHISATEAEQLLMTKGLDGSFLVRTSTNDPKAYCVSYRVINKVLNIKFETTEEGYTVKNIPDEYPTIEALITVVQKSMPGLDYPLWPSDPAPEGLLPRLFFGRLSTKHAEKLLLDPDAARDRNFIIRSSTSTDQIVISVRLESGEVVHVLTYRQGDKFLVKGTGNAISFDSFKQLLDFYMGGRIDMEQIDGTVIRLMKPMICPWNNDPCGPSGKTSTLPAKKPDKKSHRDVTEKFHEPTSPVYWNVGNKGTGNVYENIIK